MTIVQTQSTTTQDLEKSYSSDVLLGAYLMSHFRPHCENCGTLNTPQWRKGWFSEVLQHSVLLCNACGLKYHKNQFCPYCKFVYGKEQKLSNLWLICETCARWVHIECEKRFGGHEHHSPYQCPDCRSSSSPVTLPNEVSAAEMREHALEVCPKPSDFHQEKVSHEDYMDMSIDEDYGQGKAMVQQSPFIVPSTLNLV